MPRTLFQDVQLENRTRTRWIFLSAVATKRGEEINFKGEEVKFENEENIPIMTHRIGAVHFSAWWIKMRNEGWRVCG